MKFSAYIEQRIEDWHKSNSELPLHEWLGWTKEEYAGWVEVGSIPLSEYEKAFSDLENHLMALKT